VFSLHQGMVVWCGSIHIQPILFMMSSDLQTVISALVSSVVDRGGYVTKTKLLKLLYLFDVEYFRLHRKIFTGLQWKFFHLGPWAPEFDPILAELVMRGTLLESVSQKGDYETRFYRAAERVGIERLAMLDSKGKTAFGVVLKHWANSTTGEILDYVYFRTEPMETGIRNEPLDFSRIPEYPIPTYARSSSGLNLKDIDAAKRRFADRVTSPKAVNEGGLIFTPPRYDEEFDAAMSKLEEASL
jgi:hypothetical protein